MIGIDEVGRGCWAGPLLVVAARANAQLPVGLKDSKMLPKSRRELLKPLIAASCDIGEGWVSAAEIDRVGLASALRLGVKRALKSIGAFANEEIIMDGLVNYCPKKYTAVCCQAKADNNYPIVSAASIFAKVTRDIYMSKLKRKYQHYEFANHVGYGTKRHQELLSLHGPCDLHRLSFAPLLKFATL